MEWLCLRISMLIPSSSFKQETGTNISVLLTMVTTYGLKLKANSYSFLVQNSLTMDALFMA
ncbi:MAG: hypothetical protein K0B11_20525 [Mariniphaga sp.]|nr:hypothetical protein [Mariniphaga sp.]